MSIIKHQPTLMQRLVTKRNALVLLLVIYGFIGTIGVLTINKTFLESLVPRFELATMYECITASQDIKEIPSYKIWFSKDDFSKLTQPNETLADGTLKPRSLVQATVLIHENNKKDDQVIRARIRKRGFMQPTLDRPFPLKIELIGAPDTDFKVSHLIYMGELVGKNARWFPLHMRVAEQLGLITPENRLVKVHVNGKYWGVFWQFSHWGNNTLSKNGIQNGEIYGENDEGRGVAIQPFWESIDGWKNYSSDEVNTQAITDYTNLNSFLEFVNKSSNNEFNKGIFEYLDFDSAVAWTVHMAMMDSYHQTNENNARLAFDNDIGKFKPIPWDALPGIFGRVQTLPYLRSPFKDGDRDQQFQTSNVLLVRLMNNPKFLNAYSKKLKQEVDWFLSHSADEFNRLYMSTNLQCAMLENPFFEETFFSPPFRAKDLRSPSTYKRIMLESRWHDEIAGMKLHFDKALRKLSRLIEIPQVRVTQEHNPEGLTKEPVKKVKVNLRYSAQLSARFVQISIPLTSTPNENISLAAQITLRAIPPAKIYDLTSHSGGEELDDQVIEIKGELQGNRLSFNNLNLHLIPDYPDRATDTHFWGPIRSQEYELSIQLADGLMVDHGNVNFLITNDATNEPVEIVNKYVSTTPSEKPRH